MSVSPLALITLNRSGITVPPSIPRRRYEFSERDAADKVVRRCNTLWNIYRRVVQLKQKRSYLKVEFPISSMDIRVCLLFIWQRILSTFFKLLSQASSCTIFENIFVHNVRFIFIDSYQRRLILVEGELILSWRASLSTNVSYVIITIYKIGYNSWYNRTMILLQNIFIYII